MPGKVKGTVKCDNCARSIRISPGYKKIDDLVYRYFRCRRCKKVFVISVTDHALRQGIKRYEEIIERMKTQIVPPEVLQEAQKIIENNVRRSRELKLQYPLELKTWER